METDSIYIFFDGKKQQLKENPKSLPIPSVLEPIASYKFLFDAEGKSYIQFVRSTYLNVEAIAARDETETRTVKKCFLRKNKDKLIDNDFFKKKGIEESFWYISRYKIIYLIDRTEMKNGKIPVYEVGIYSTYFPQS